MGSCPDGSPIDAGSMSWSAVFFGGDGSVLPVGVPKGGSAALLRAAGRVAAAAAASTLPS